jgi:sulfoquinovosidase
MRRLTCMARMSFRSWGRRAAPGIRQLVALTALAAGLACGPSRVEQTMNGVDVLVDAEAGRIALSRAGRVLLDVGAAGIGSRRGTPFYEMQFGMFAIEEERAPFAFSTRLVIEDIDEGRVGFALVRDGGAAGEERLPGHVAAREGGVEVQVAAPGENEIVLRSACAFGHAIGFGGQTHDVDHVGQRVPLWVSEPGIGKVDTDELPDVWQVVGRRHTSSAPIPAFVADNGAAYVLRTDAFARVDLCATEPGVAAFEAWDGALALQVWAGATPREAQAKMVDALGRPPLPAPWVLAPWNDAIFGSDNVRAVAERLRALDIPSSALWTEDFRGGARSGAQYRLDEDWGVDDALYPDFEDMVADLNTLGFQSLTYYNTFVVTGADIFDEVIENGWAIEDESGAPYLFSGPDRDFSPTALLDLTDPGAREFMKGFLRADLARGVRGWMADFAEWQPVEGAVLASGEDPARAHNRYPVLWQALNREVLEEEGRLEDSAVFVRSAWLGSQPLAQVLWAGDQRTSFGADDGLPTILPMGIGLSAVGFPFYTHDIAGYQSATNEPVDQELFFRWTTLGALSPVMRTHHGTHVFQNVNVFTNEETTAHFRRWAELHVRLYPYLRRLAIDATAPGGLPLWVPLPLLFPDDDVWGLMDEVMLGPSLLVAPVVARGETTREVTFPRARFAPFQAHEDGSALLFAGDDVVGPARVLVNAPVNELPLFIVAGGIVPMTALPADTLLPVRDRNAGFTGLESVEGDRIVVIGRGADGSFVEESGASYTYEDDGSAVLAGSEPDGSLVIIGNDVAQSGAVRLELAGHPAARRTRVIFR